MGHQDIHQQSRAVAICIWSGIEDKETLETLLQTVKNNELPQHKSSQDQRATLHKYIPSSHPSSPRCWAHDLLSHVLKKEGDHLKLLQQHSDSPSVFLSGEAQPNSETSTKHPNKLESFQLLLHQPSMLNNRP